MRWAWMNKIVIFRTATVPGTDVAELLFILPVLLFILLVPVATAAATVATVEEAITERVATVVTAVDMAPVDTAVATVATDWVHSIGSGAVATEAVDTAVA